MPSQNRRPRAPPAAHDARPLIDATNETTYAFLGVQRPAWMTRAFSDSSAGTREPPPRPRPQSRPVVAPRDATQGAAWTGATVFPSPVLSSISSPEASTPRPGTDGGHLAVEAPPPPPPSAAVQPVSQSRVPSPPPPDISSTALAGDASHTPSAFAKGPTAADDTTQQGLITAMSEPAAELVHSSNDLPSPSSALLPTQPTTPSAETMHMTPHSREMQLHAGALEAPEGRQKRHCGDPIHIQGTVTDISVPVNDGPDYGRLLELVNIEILAAGGSGSLDPEREAPRYKLLREACNKKDLFYLALHQLSCLWSLSKDKVYQVLKAQPQVIDTAFGILLQVLRKNSDIRPNHLHWLSLFPLALKTHQSRIPQRHAARVISQVTTFLEKLALSWNLVIAKIFQRGYPLMAWELKLVFHCPSPVLQWILFTSTRRVLGVGEGPVAHEMSRLFSMDRRNEFSQAVETAESIQNRNAIESRYRTLMLQIRGSASNFAPAENSTQALTQQPLDMQYAPPPPYYTMPAPQNVQCALPATYYMMPPPQMQNLSLPSPQPLSPFLPPNCPTSHGSGGHAMPPFPQPTFGVNGDAVVGVADRPAHGGQTTMAMAQDHHLVAGMFGSPHVAGFGQPAGALSSSVPATGFPSQAMSPQFQSPHHVQNWPALQQDPATAVQAVQRPPMPEMMSVESQLRPRAAPAFTPPAPRLNVSHLQQQRAAPQSLRPVQSRGLAVSGYGQPPGINQHHQHPRARGPSGPTTRMPASPSEATLPRQYQTVPLNAHEYPRDELSAVQNSLHLSFLRSPERTCSKPCGRRFYQFMTSFAVQPQALPPQSGLRVLRFSVSEEDLSNLVAMDTTSEVPTAMFSSGSLRYRLRLCKQGVTTQQVQEAGWTVCPGFWPPHIFLTCNGHSVQPRRRQHFQHDLPIELTGLVCSGENTIQVSLPRVEVNIDKSSTYFMGVEVVATLDHEAVRALVQANDRISPEETKREIKRRLNPNDSDDVIAESDRIFVAVTDPFSSSLFTTPVRGTKCKHMECFDLEIWLRTRPRKTARDPDEPSMADCWNCPICGLDARPVSLRIDEFFSEVRAKLLESGDTAVRKIAIHSDGSWSRVLEADEVEDEGQPATTAQERPGAVQKPGLESVSEVIVIEDD